MLQQRINVYTTYLEGYQPQSNTVSLMPQTGSLKGGSLSNLARKQLEGSRYESYFL
jgi:iron complex outermembrane receptor protein